MFSSYAATKNVERGPGFSIGVTTPGPRCAAPGKGSAQALYACLPERCLVPREGVVGGDAGAVAPALQPWALSAFASIQTIDKRTLHRWRADD
jgi:hypothetical protein